MIKLFYPSIKDLKPLHNVGNLFEPFRIVLVLVVATLSCSSFQVYLEVFVYVAISDWFEDCVTFSTEIFNRTSLYDNTIPNLLVHQLFLFTLVLNVMETILLITK